MVEKDKSMEAMISNDDEKAWMTPLLEFRNRFGDEEKDRGRRSFKKMQGFLQGSYEQLHHGPYLKEWRELWLRELLERQVEIQKYGPEEFREYELITLPELRCIRRIWVYDKHEFDDSLPRIYKSVIGKEFDDPEWIGSSAFGEDEWRLLGEVCDRVMKTTQFTDSKQRAEKATEQRKFDELENLRDNLSLDMIASLIDVENHANSVHDRKGILDELEKCIKKDFYIDETDATEYYRKQLQRKKDLGGKYNEKFFVNIKDEGEEFEDVSEGTE